MSQDNRFPHAPQKMTPAQALRIAIEKEITPAEGALDATTRRRRLVAVWMVVLSFFLYAGLFFIPFLPVQSKTKVVVFSVLFVTSEVAFWGGGLILGKEALKRYQRYLNPVRWFRPAKDETSLAQAEPSSLPPERQEGASPPS